MTGLHKTALSYYIRIERTTTIFLFNFLHKFVLYVNMKYISLRFSAAAIHDAALAKLQQTIKKAAKSKSEMMYIFKIFYAKLRLVIGN